MTSVVIAAGGTGGHIYPGLAVADAARRADPAAAVSFIGTPRGLEQKLIPTAGWRLNLVDMIPFTGWRRGILPAALVRAAAQARAILRAEKADVVVGMGGYPSIPVILAARWLHIPAVIHESGAVAGRANRISARFTSCVAMAFESARGSFSANVEGRVVGMPLSANMAAFDRDALRPEARAAFEIEDDKTFLFVVNGGSQGSTRLNEVGVELAQRWKGRDDVRVVIKAGNAHAENVQQALDANGLNRVATAVGYFDRIDYSYAAADLALTRGGAGTVAELTVTGLPAIIVPYPYHTDDHQALNAGVLVDFGAAVMVRDDQATADCIGPLVEELIGDRAKLTAMATAARGAAHPHAADDLVAWALELCHR
ncbi:MAG: undecaprenyldiphospho-muramoylpentapeptide beta-N-acetylglucosaminyltransferase [Actinobacteria bacterium]|nr:undecaprenyldiphospho-muramoylpentapeptide beta-N-acetylglucosaminyltransferase [Actinomycetota bacterium]